jgi:hypothetical protein
VLHAKRPGIKGDLLLYPTHSDGDICADKVNGAVREKA